MKSEKRSIFGEVSGDGNKLVGYGAVFNSPTRISEGGRDFTEVIKPGAFRSALASNGDVVATYNHNPEKLLGRTASGTLRLQEDTKGLRFELDLPDTPTGNELRALVARGDIRGASFTFMVRRGGEAWDGSTRTLTDLHLIELGPVTFPAYEATSVGLRSANFQIMRMLLELRSKK